MFPLAVYLKYLRSSYTNFSSLRRFGKSSTNYERNEIEVPDPNRRTVGKRNYSSNATLLSDHSSYRLSYYKAKLGLIRKPRLIGLRR